MEFGREFLTAIAVRSLSPFFTGPRRASLALRGLG
jgi:hypothetical protein